MYSKRKYIYELCVHIHSIISINETGSYCSGRGRASKIILESMIPDIFAYKYGHFGQNNKSKIKNQCIAIQTHKTVSFTTTTLLRADFEDPFVLFLEALGRV